MEHNHVGGMACTIKCPVFAFGDDPQADLVAAEPEAAFLYAENMTLRDHFAGLAMAAYLSVAYHTESNDGTRARGNPDVVAAWAYQNADAMLAERAKVRS